MVAILRRQHHTSNSMQPEQTAAAVILHRIGKQTLSCLAISSCIFFFSCASAWLYVYAISFLLVSLKSFFPFVLTCLLTFVVLSEAKHYWRILYVVRVCVFFFVGHRVLVLESLLLFMLLAWLLLMLPPPLLLPHEYFFLAYFLLCWFAFTTFLSRESRWTLLFPFVGIRHIHTHFFCVLHVAGNERRRAQTETLALRTITFFFFFHTFLFLKFRLYIYLVVCKSKIGFTLFYITWDSFVLFCKKNLFFVCVCVFFFTDHIADLGVLKYLVFSPVFSGLTSGVLCRQPSN